MAIPKVIHYCWFGGNPMPAKEKRCMASWRRYLRDYEFKLWNESNFDINSIEFVRKAYAAKKWAFVADYVRCYALYTEGGIYLDADVEIKRDIAPLLGAKLFSGFNLSGDLVEPAVIGSEKNHPIMEKMLQIYNNVRFEPDIKYLLEIMIPKLITPIIVREYGLVLNGKSQKLDKDISIYSLEILFMEVAGSKKAASKSAYTIHHCSGSWGTWRWKIAVLIAGYLGNDVFLTIASVWGRLRKLIKL